jgi:hypothetical protein
MVVSGVLIPDVTEGIAATPPGGPPPAGAGSLPAPRVPLEMLEALVASVEQLVAAFDRSPQAGCVAAGTPAVEIALIHLWDAEARDSMPPRVEAVGVGSCAAGSVPAVMLEAFVASVEHEFAALLRSPQAG